MRGRSLKRRGKSREGFQGLLDKSNQEFNQGKSPRRKSSPISSNNWNSSLSSVKGPMRLKKLVKHPVSFHAIHWVPASP